MQRKKIVAGNWKMNTNLESARTLANNISKALEQNPTETVDVILAPPFPFLGTVVGVAEEKYAVAAQNMSQHEAGAYTGEISADMLQSLGVQYVILGHSERRAYYGETNELLAEKVQKAIESDLVPIYCIGESLKERKSNQYLAVIEQQLSVALFDLSEEDFGKVVIAYEPVWAIGTGETATPEQAQEVHAYIRKLIQEKYNETVAEATSLLYGGSCKPGNAKELFAQEDIDGGLIGGAALKAEDFTAIIHSF